MKSELQNPRLKIVLSMLSLGKKSEHSLVKAFLECTILAMLLKVVLKGNGIFVESNWLRVYLKL